MRLRKRVGPAADPGKHVFVSYSRQDREDVEGLKERLGDKGVNVWIDLVDIPVSSQWRDEVADGIRRSDVFLFVVTPRSVSSAMCREELALAVEYGKRIVPLVHEAVPRQDLPQALDPIQETNGDDTDELVRVLALDLDRVHRHTLLLVQAYEWSVNGRRRSTLLRGRDLRTAVGWLADSTADAESSPTGLQREYIAKGRSAARRRWGAGTVFAAVLTTVALIVGLAQVEAAHQARSRELATRSEDALKDGLDLGLLLGREAVGERPTVEARRALFTALRTRPRQARFLDVLAGVPAARRDDPLRHLPLAVQPGGRLLAVPLRDGVRLVTLPTGRPAWNIRGPVGTPVFSPDGRWLAVATRGDPRSVQLVDVAERRVTERLTVPQSRGRPDPGNDLIPVASPTAVAFSPDSASLAMPANDNTLRIRHLKDHRWSAPLKGHAQIYDNGLTEYTNFINTVAFSPDGRLLVSGDWRGDVLVWDTRTGRRLTKLSVSAGKKRAGAARTLAFDPKGTHLAAGTGLGALTVWRTDGWKVVVEPEPAARANPVDALAFSPDGRVLVTGGSQTGARLWEVGSWEFIGERLSKDHLSGTSAVFLDHGTSMIWGVQGTGRLAVWDVRGPGTLGEVVRGSPGDAVAVGRGSGGRVAVGGADGTITVGGLTLRHELSGQASSVSLRALALSEDERTLFSASDDGSVKGWDVTSGTRRADWSLGTMTTAVTLGDHGRLVAAATYDGHIVVRRVADHKLLVKVPEGDENVRELAFSRDGSLLVAGTEGGTAVLVDVVEGRVLGTLGGYDSYVRGLAFSPDAKTLAVASEDGTYAFWDVPDRRRIGDRMPAHIGEVLSAEFSPDGRLLALGGDQGRVLLVDVATRRALGPALTTDTAPAECVGSPCQPVGDLVFTPDGRHLLSATDAARHIYDESMELVVDASSIRQPGATLWSTDLASWIRAACTRADRNLTDAEQDRFGIGRPTPCPA